MVEITEDNLWLKKIFVQDADQKKSNGKILRWDYGSAKIVGIVVLSSLKMEILKKVLKTLQKWKNSLKSFLGENNIFLKNRAL
jgi:hypothetical protein